MAERTAISMASRSRCPDLRRPLKMTRNNWSTSRAISFWIASAVFFLWRKHIRFGRAQLADLRVDLDQFLRQVLQFPEFSDFSFGLSRCGLVGQGFGNSLAVDLEGQAEKKPAIPPLSSRTPVRVRLVDRRHKPIVCPTRGTLPHLIQRNPNRIVIRLEDYARQSCRTILDDPGGRLGYRSARLRPIRAQPLRVDSTGRAGGFPVYDSRADAQCRGRWLSWPTGAASECES